MTASTSFLNPSLIDIWRAVPGDTVGPTGGQTATPTQLYSQIPAFVDHATRGVSDKLEFSMPTGEVVEQTDICFIDGLVPQQFAGFNPGDSVTVNGIAYIVDPDGRGAFPDVQPFDVIVRGTDRYLVLQATKYDDVEPSIQLHLNFGKAWEIPPAPAPPSEDSTVNFTDADFPGAGDFTVQNGGDATVTGSSINVSGASEIDGTLVATETSYLGTTLKVGVGASLTMNGCSFDVTAIDIESATLDFENAAVFSEQSGVLANFSFAATALEVAFSDSSYTDGTNGHVTAWSWDFGDSSGTSALQNPSYTYGAPGTYNVTLTVTTSSSATCVTTIPVTVS